MSKLFLLVVSLCLTFASASLYAQLANGRTHPVSFSIKHTFQQSNIPFLTIPSLDKKQLEVEDAQWNSEGNIPRIGRILPVNINPLEKGVWHTLKNGDRIWQMRIIAENAQAISLYFGKYNLPKGAQIHVYSTDKKSLIGGFGADNNQESGLMATDFVYAQDITIEYYEPAAVKGQGAFIIDEIGYGYKAITDFGDSESCQVNVNCSEGSSYQNQRNAVARILVRVGNSQGWCTGTLVNNVRQDCTPYFLTALHCALSGSNIASTSNMNQWLFYFNYQSTGCSSPSTQPSTSQSLTGAVIRANSNDGGGNSGSDMLLLQLNSTPPASYNAYYAGWNANTSTTTGGYGIHHPSGDIKKISRFTGTTSSTSWGGTASGSHWGVNWVATSNGHGTTEGGSSGSALFNNNGQIIGTLTGGGSSCANRNAADAYGKMSYHWTSNGSSSSYRLKDWLDPNNTGTLSLSGIAAPCTINSLDAGIVEILNPQDGYVTCENPLVPSVVLRNYGSSTLTRATINYRVNTNTALTYSWTGSLASGMNTTITLPSVTIPTNTAVTLKVWTSVPNNGTDALASNDTSTVNTMYETPAATPYAENFNAGSIPGSIFVYNPDADDFSWTYANGVSINGSGGSIKYDNYNGTNNANPRGTLDWFILPDISFANNPNPILTYDIAHRPYSTTSNDSLFIVISTDCGATYNGVYGDGGTRLASVTGVLTTEFTPSTSQWANRTLNLSSYANLDRVSIAFISKSNWGNNIYIDNININGGCNITLNVTNQTNVNCYNASTGAMTLSATGGTAPYRYKWNANNEQSSATFSNLVSGVYTVTVTDANGCTATTPVSITQPSAALAASNTVTNIGPSCTAQSNGSIVITATGGTSPYRYNRGNGIQTSNTFNNLSAGTYVITVTDANSCTITTTATLTSSAPNINVSVATSAPINCFNGTTSLIVTATGGATPYSYNRGTGAQSSNTFTGVSAGTYTITVTDANACSVTARTTVTAPSMVTGTVTRNNVSCMGENTGRVTVSATGGTSPYTYNRGTGAQTSNIFTALAAGSYTITITDARGCTGTVSTTITQPSSALTARNTANDPGFTCNGQSNGSIVVTATGGTSPYTYNRGTGSQNSNTFNSLSGGTYVITVTDANGCTVTTTAALASIPVIPVLNATVSTGPAMACSDGTTSLLVTATGGTAPYTYNIGTGSQASNTFTGVSVGTHTVTVTDANGCYTTVVTTVTAPSAVTANATRNNILCMGESSGGITVTATGGTSPYTYNIGTGSQTSNVFSALAAGSYTITITDSRGCVGTVTTTITEPSIRMTAEVYHKGDLTCHDDVTGGYFLVTALNGTTPYSYNIGNGAQTSNRFNNLAAGTYTATVTDANGCMATVTQTIVRPATQLTASIAEQTNVLCFGANTGSVRLTATGGMAPYEFFMGARPQSSTGVFTNIPAGNHEVLIMDSLGCMITVDVNILSASDIIIPIQVENVSCAGNDGAITTAVQGGTAPYTYTWSTGATTSNLVQMASGIYNLTVTDANGCTKSTSVMIMNNCAANCNILIDANIINNDCFGDCDAQINLTINNAQAPYLYTWSNGVSIANNIGLCAGTYAVTVIDANGCVANENYTVTTPNSLLTINATVSNDNYTASAMASGGTAPYTYEWSNGSNSATLTNVSTSGNYTVTVTDANGCTAVSNIVEIYVVGIEHVNSAMAFEVYPNPNNGDFNVKVEYMNTQDFDIILIDVLGRQLASYNFNQMAINMPMNLKNLADGVYFIILKNDTQMQSKKVIIAR